MGEGVTSSDLTAADIASYAVLLGIDPAREFDLLWIAEEALTVELPADWAEHFDEQSGNYYYHNVKSGNVQWVSPLESKYQTVVEFERARSRQKADENASSEFNAYFACYGGEPEPEPEPEPKPEPGAQDALHSSGDQSDKKDTENAYDDLHANQGDESGAGVVNVDEDSGSEAQSEGTQESQDDMDAKTQRSGPPSAADSSDPDGFATAAAHILVLRHSWPGASALSDNDLEDLLAFCVYMSVSPGEVDCLDVVAAAMNAPCPSGWNEREDEDSGKFYYYCTESKEVSWSHPQDAVFRAQIETIRVGRTPLLPGDDTTVHDGLERRDQMRLQAEEAEAAARAAAVSRSALEAAEQKAAVSRAKKHQQNEAQLQREVKRRQEELKQRAKEEAQRRRDILRAREREAAWRRATSTVEHSRAETESSLRKAPRGRVQRSTATQRYIFGGDDGVRVSSSTSHNIADEKEARQELKRRQEQRLKELRVEMAAKARDAEEIARVQKRVDAEVDQWAARKSLAEMLRTIGQVWPPATAKVAAAGALPASTKRAKMQVLRLVHPDKVDMNAPVELKAKAQRIFTTLQSQH
eukprot:COSAG02_NODE_252_length_26996_cov_29.825607_14_plen_583_part_00